MLEESFCKEFKMFLFRGFAFVTFKDPSSVQAVIEQNNNGGHTLDGKVVSGNNSNEKFFGCKLQQNKLQRFLFCIYSHTS